MGFHDWFRLFLEEKYFHGIFTMQKNESAIFANELCRKQIIIMFTE